LPYHCDLSTNEFIWNVIKTRVAQINAHHSAAETQNITIQVTGNITEKDWKNAM